MSSKLISEGQAALLVKRPDDTDILFRWMPNGDLFIEVDNRYQRDGVGGYETTIVPANAANALIEYIKGGTRE